MPQVQQQLADYLRSSAWDDLYPKDRLIESFGTVTPTLSQRTEFFNALWDEWARNSIQLPSDLWYINRKILSKIGTSLGFDYGWDFNIRYRELRTRSPEIMALFLLAMPKYIGQE